MPKSELHYAVFDKNGLNTVKKLIEEGKADVNLIDDLGDRTVDYAAQCGSLATLKYLIEEAKADIQTRNGKQNLMVLASYNKPDVIAYITNPQHKFYKEFKDGTTDLHAAAFSGRIDEVKAILTENPGRIHESNAQGDDVLHWLVLGKQLENAAPLISFDASHASWVLKKGRLEGATLFQIAIHDGCSSVVQTLLTAKVNPNEFSPKGAFQDFSPLHLAAQSGHPTIFQSLLAANTNPNDPITFHGPYYGYSPIHLAAYHGHQAIVEILLAAKINPDEFSKGEDNGYVLTGTPIHMAAFKGHLTVVEMLLAAKANPKTLVKRRGIEEDGNAPIHLAAREGHLAIVKALLAAKVDPHEPSSVGHSKGDTALQIAAGAGHLGIVQLLLEEKMHPNAYNSQKRALASAAYYGKSEIVQTLLEAKLDPNECCLGVLPPLYAAARSGHFEIIQILIAAKADPSLCVQEGENKSWSPLHIAASCLKAKAVQTLLAAKVDPNEPIKEGKNEGLNPLHLTTLNNQSELIQPLLSAKANLNETVNKGKYSGFAAIHLAALNGSDKILRYLLEAKINPNEPVKEGLFLGYSPLHLAASSNHYNIQSVVKTLIAAKASVDEAIQEGHRAGHTPVHLAAELGYSFTLQALLEVKADPNGGQGFTLLTPLQWALHNKHDNVVKILIDAKADPRDSRETLSQPKPISPFLQKANSDAAAPKKTAAIPSKPSQRPVDKRTPLQRAIDAAFSSSTCVASELISFDKSVEPGLKNYLQQRCKEKNINLTKDKIKFIINAIRSKVTDKNISAADIAESIKEHLYQEKTIKPVEVKRETKNEALETIADKYDAFDNLKNKINDLIDHFAPVNCDDIIAPFTRENLPSRQLKEAYSLCKGCLSQHDTNKKLFTKLKNNNTLAREAKASPENLKAVNKAIDDALLLQAEMSNTINKFTTQKEELIQALKKHKTSNKKDQTIDKKEDKKAAVLAKLQTKKNLKEQKSLERKQEKERYQQAQKARQEAVSSVNTVSPTTPEPESKSAPSEDKGPKAANTPVVAKSDEALDRKKRHDFLQRKLKILGGAVHHLLCIGILATDYIELLETKEESESLSASALQEKHTQKEQRLEILHYALLYNISRCFQALKVYKQLEHNTNASLENISKELLEDLRNMIVKLGALDADKQFVLETAKKLTKFLPRSLCEMRKAYLTVPVLNESQINDLVNVFGLANNPLRFELDAYPLPIDELPLYQQLAQCHEQKKVASLTPAEFETKIWQKAIPLIKQIIASVRKVHPQAPLKLSDDKFNEYFWREIQALKMLLSSCGVPFEVAECKKRKDLAKKRKSKLKERAQPTMKFYDFLAFCRKYITNAVGHAFENTTEFLNYDATVENIYQACFKLDAIEGTPFFGNLRTKSLLHEKKETQKKFSSTAGHESKQTVAALVSRGSGVYSSIDKAVDKDQLMTLKPSTSLTPISSPGDRRNL